MKLLSKQEINVQKTGERKLAIDEGVKLAKRVDGLREVNLSEEAQNKLNREETLRLYRLEEEEMTGKIAKLLITVTALEVRKAEAMIPLDAKWDEVNAFERHLLAKEADFSEREARFEEKQEDFNQRDLKLKKDTLEVKRLGTSLTTKEIEIDLLLNSAHESNNDSKRKNDEITSTLAIHNRDIAKREAILETREKAVDTKIEQLKVDRAELVNQERIINDRYQTLERGESNGKLINGRK